MRRIQAGLGVLALSTALATAPAWGAKLTASVQDATVIQDGVGSGRILFRADTAIRNLTDTVISRATLTVNLTGTPSRRSLTLRVHPVTTDWTATSAAWSSGWTRPGGDYDEEMFATAEVDLSGGTATAVFDLTSTLKEIVERGFTADGFVLTVHPLEGTGLATEDVARFAGLATARWDLRYRKTPSAKRAQFQRR